MICDESLAFVLAAVLLIFVVFYTLSISASEACFSSSSPTDKYSFIDDDHANFSPNWSGLDGSDKTVVMDVTRGRALMDRESPVSATATRNLVDQEYGKPY